MKGRRSSEGNDPKRVRVLISGRVQGVFFRASTREEATRLGLSGWVRNLPGGQVEAAFQGPATAVEEMTRWCGKGPPYAEVTGVEVSEEPLRPEEAAAFRIR